MKRISLPDKQIVIINENNKERFEKLTFEDTSVCAGICVRRDRTIYIGVFDKTKATLHHELFHCIDFINNILYEFEACKFSESNAYLSTYLFNELQKGLK
mgnify:CR=1 FL=1